MVINMLVISMVMISMLVISMVMISMLVTIMISLFNMVVYHHDGQLMWWGWLR